MDNYIEKSLENLIEVEKPFINSIKEKEALFFSLENIGFTGIVN